MSDDRPPERLSFLSRVRRRDGQSLILVAIALPVLLLFLAFVVDAAHAFVDYRHLQNAADASSLAGAQQIGQSTDCAGVPASNQAAIAQCATQYVSYNNGPSLPSGLPQCAAAGLPITTYISSDPPATPSCYQWPYIDKNGVSHPDEVVVWLHNCASTFFGGIIGVNSICETVRSVSQNQPQTTTSTQQGTTTGPTTIFNVSTGTTTVNGSQSVFTTTTQTTVPGTTSPGTTVYSTETTNVTSSLHEALFADNSSCTGTGITIGPGPGTGNGTNLVGQVISNGAVTINGNPQVNAGDVVMSSTCGSPPGHPGGSEKTKYNSLSTHSSALPWPETFDAPTICSGSSVNNNGTIPQTGAITLNVDTTTPSGVYCSDTSITVSGNASSAITATLIAPQVYITAQNVTLSPAYAGLLVYDTCGNSGVVACIVPTVNPPQPMNCPVALCLVANNSNHTGLTGVIWVPNGDINYQGNAGATGLFEAQNITISGNGLNMTGTGGTFTGPTTSTVAISTIGQTTAVSTSYSTSTGTVTTPSSTSSSTTTTPLTIQGTTVPPRTQTNTTSTNFGLVG